jgi:hypothetical protein
MDVTSGSKYFDLGSIRESFVSGYGFFAQRGKPNGFSRRRLKADSIRHSRQA